MSTLAAATPSPPPHIHTPPTPKHGYSDSWEPYSPRKSVRLSSQSISAAHTPSPKSSNLHSHHHHLRSPRSTKRDYSDTTVSPMPSPRKKSMPTMGVNRGAPGQLTAEGTANAATSLGLPRKTDSRPGRANTSSHAGMLLTPAKTPVNRKDASAQNEANIAAIARNLFSHSEEDMIPSSTKKKRAKKYSGLSMDSFVAEEIEESIKIHIDSHERIPEVDNSVNNPFFGGGAAAPPEPAKRRSKRRQVSIPGEGKESIEHASHRNDGLVYVFRGKKIFRKFEEEADDQDDGQQEDEDASLSAAPTKRLTRSSIKPRLLFPSSNKGKEIVNDDEEADTDIEDSVEVEDDNRPETPQDHVDDVPSTPGAPRFAPASPPITGRTTRSGNKAAEELTPMKPTRGGKRSPFETWRQTKSGPGSINKRPGQELGTSVPAKRVRA